MLREFDDHFNKFALKLLSGEETVSHSPCEYSRIAMFFITCGGLIFVEVRFPSLQDDISGAQERQC